MFDQIPTGPTGSYMPGGPARPGDRGGLAATIGTTRGLVVIDFTAPVAWLSLTPAEARTLAVELLARAELLDPRDEGRG